MLIMARAFLQRMEDLAEKVAQLESIWRRKIRNRPVTRAVIGCSYNDYTPADDHVREQVANEREAGHFFVNHLVLREKDAAVDNLKFHHLIDGVPAMVYVLMNVLHSGIQEAVVIGSDETRQILGAFQEVYKATKFRFVHEGSDWSLSNTLQRARDALPDAAGELVMFLPGDVPFLFNIDQVIGTHDTLYYDAIANLNNRQRAGRYFPRNYHLRVRSRIGRIYDVKEPNVCLLNLHKIPLHLVDAFYGNRKSYLDLEGGKSLPELLFGGGRWKGYIRTIRSELPMFIRLVPKVTSRVNSRAVRYALQPLAWAVSCYQRIAPTTPLISITSLQDIADLSLNMRTHLKVTNRDPATLEDLDSYEDWAYMNAMARAGDKVYPHFQDLQRFKGVMPDLQRVVPLFSRYGDFMNGEMEKFGFCGSYYSDGTPFLQRLPFTAGSFDLAFAHPRVREMVAKNIAYHRRYLRIHNLFRK